MRVFIGPDEMKSRGVGYMSTFWSRPDRPVVSGGVGMPSVDAHRGNLRGDRVVVHRQDLPGNERIAELPTLPNGCLFRWCLM